MNTYSRSYMRDEKPPERAGAKVAPARKIQHHCRRRLINLQEKNEQPFCNFFHHLQVSAYTITAIKNNRMSELDSGAVRHAHGDRRVTQIRLTDEKSNLRNTWQMLPDHAFDALEPVQLAQCTVCRPTVIWKSRQNSVSFDLLKEMQTHVFTNPAG